jgi:hypothetical protein
MKIPGLNTSIHLYTPPGGWSIGTTIDKHVAKQYNINHERTAVFCRGKISAAFLPTAAGKISAAFLVESMLENDFYLFHRRALVLLQNANRLL